jgi:TRAP-type mannitol/chloroaromatic compound transport system permease large subunit
LKGVAPPEISTTDIWKSAAPFIVLQVLGVIMLMMFPQIALFLPGVFY